MLSGVLQSRPTPAAAPKPRSADELPEPVEAVEPVEAIAAELPEDETPEADGLDQSAGKGRGRRASTGRAPKGRGKGGKVQGRTIYLPDDLFERIMVQSHRRKQTISDYVTDVLNRNVPDHLARGRADTDAA